VDSAGNLYGTTLEGGAHGYGAVYELSPPTGGQTRWTETVLFSFDGYNGGRPSGDLLADRAGNLYGTTLGGGGSVGVAFELSPPATGQITWTETVLVYFDGANGFAPMGSLIADGAGNLYGTTQSGGANSAGVAFELSPPAAGQTVWTETVLLSFSGFGPEAGLVADGEGNLYGTMTYGGAYSDGTVYELSPPAAGQTAWAETVLFSFNGTNGERPIAGLIADGAGNLYGTTWYGGANFDGGVSGDGVGSN